MQTEARRPRHARRQRRTRKQRRACRQRRTRRQTSTVHACPMRWLLALLCWIVIAPLLTPAAHLAVAVLGSGVQLGGEQSPPPPARPATPASAVAHSEAHAEGARLRQQLASTQAELERVAVQQAAAVQAAGEWPGVCVCR